MEGTIGDGTTAWALMRAGRVTGRGRVAPRIAFEIFFRTPREKMSAQILLMRAELVDGAEVLGDATLTGVEVVPGEYVSSVEIPVSRAALDHLATLVTGEQVDLTLRLSGWLRVRNDNEDGQQFASEPKRGEWTYQGFGVGRQTELRFQIARSNWYS
jgi:hypothetical protein